MMEKREGAFESFEGFMAAIDRLFPTWLKLFMPRPQQWVRLVVHSHVYTSWAVIVPIPPKGFDRKYVAVCALLRSYGDVRTVQEPDFRIVMFGSGTKAALQHLRSRLMKIGYSLDEVRVDSEQLLHTECDIPMRHGLLTA